MTTGRINQVSILVKASIVFLIEGPTSVLPVFSLMSNTFLAQTLKSFAL